MAFATQYIDHSQLQHVSRKSCTGCVENINHVQNFLINAKNVGFDYRKIPSSHGLRFKEVMSHIHDRSGGRRKLAVPCHGRLSRGIENLPSCYCGYRRAMPGGWDTTHFVIGSQPSCQRHLVLEFAISSYRARRADLTRGCCALPPILVSPRSVLATTAAGVANGLEDFCGAGTGVSYGASR